MQTHPSGTSPPARAARRWLDCALLGACIVVAAIVSICLGQDANWDLQNYHFYDPWAFVHGRTLGWDIAAAQLQTFFNPLLDLPFFAMVAAGWDARAISAVLALPAGVSAWLIVKLGWRLFGGLDATSRLVATIASVAIGVTSAMGVGTLGTTMNDWPGAALTLAALWLLVRRIGEKGAAGLPASALVAAGLLAGAASGLKLTAATFAAGIAAGVLLRPPHARARLRETMVLGTAMFAGFLATYGHWAWQLWSHYGNPFFPFANRWFGSDWWEHAPALSRIYGPHNLREWLRFPLDLYSPRPGFVAEVPYSDARIPLTYALAIVAGIGIAAQRLTRAPASEGRAEPPDVVEARVLVSIFWVVSFVLWTAQHSIARYIVVLDVTSGLLIVGMLRWMLRPAHANAVIAAVAAMLIGTTQWADWWRVDHGARWFDVRVPQVEPGAMILLVEDAPMAYVLPFFPAGARHVGLTNNVNDPRRKTLLERSAREAIRNHRGPLYALSMVPGKGDGDLAAYGLRRGGAPCESVTTRMRTSPLQLCQLERTQAQQQQ